MYNPAFIPQTLPHLDNDATAARRTTSVSLELEHAAERAAWNSTASCVVIGDVSGRLHFVTGEGTLIFSQPLARPLAGRARYLHNYPRPWRRALLRVRRYTSNCTRSRWCYSRSFSCGDRWRRSMCAIYGACVSHALVSGAVLCLPSQSDGCIFVADDRGFVRFRSRGWGVIDPRSFAHRT